MRTPCAVLAALLATGCSGPKPTPPRGAPLLTVSGHVSNGPFVFGEGDLAGLPRRAFHGRDPHLAKEIAYDGISLADLLGEKVAIDGEGDTAVIRCKDRYDVAIPLVAIRRHKPSLADKMDGAAPGAWLKWQASALGPPYLGWP